jgi:CheY-like chemotaxis protein
MATILVVEDDPTLRKLLRLTLEAAGHVCLLAADPPSALEAAATAEIDVVVTDYRLPGMTGLALTAAIRSVRPGIPALLITGDDLALRGRNEFLLPDVRVLAKPFSPRLLLGAIADIGETVDILGRPVIRPFEPRRRTVGNGESRRQ